MTGSAAVNPVLEDHPQLTVIVRLVVDRVGHLTHGQVVDLAGTSLGRFNEWRQLTPIIRSWLQSQYAGGQSAPPGAEGESSEQ